MIHNYNDDYQYDSCVSRGICSPNPRTSSLQEVLVLYLKITAYYATKLSENGKLDIPVKNLILNTISIIVSNPDFSENDFKSITSAFNKELPRIIKEYEATCKDKNIVPECLKSVLKFDIKTDIIKSIQMGEKEFQKEVEEIPQDIRNLFRVLFVLAKSICTNVLDLETYEIDSKEGYLTVLRLLNALNTQNADTDKLKTLLFEASKVDNELMHQVYSEQEKRYGRKQINEVSYTTTPAKAVLVVGSNIRELEDVLEALKDTEIDVYTHDEMMLAHTFPKFSEYKNLKGQYGQGIESCLLDFSTFPGPIILTRHSLYNVENLYRGVLYTTDFAYSKGVIPIKDKDFSPVIKSALNSKGFKTGKQCETVSVGYDYNHTMQMIREKLKTRKYSRIIIIGLNGYTLEQRVYFEKLLKKAPDDVLIISLSYCKEKENIICLNACFDIFAAVKFTEGIRYDCTLPISVFFPNCDRHTISEMIYLKTLKDINIFVGKCTPLILNPNLISTLDKVFEIKGLTTVKKDLDYILNK